VCGCVCGWVGGARASQACATPRALAAPCSACVCVAAEQQGGLFTQQNAACRQSVCTVCLAGQARVCSARHVPASVTSSVRCGQSVQVSAQRAARCACRWVCFVQQRVLCRSARVCRCCWRWQAHAFAPLLPRTSGVAGLACTHARIYVYVCAGPILSLCGCLGAIVLACAHAHQPIARIAAGAAGGVCLLAVLAPAKWGTPPKGQQSAGCCWGTPCMRAGVNGCSCPCVCVYAFACMRFA
jgi:hypothetical protein